MKIAHLFFRRMHWLNLPAAVLMVLLQRAPVLRLVGAAEQVMSAPRLGAMLRSAIATATSLGAVHALAGATQFTFSRPPPLSGTVGTTFTPFAFTVTGALTPAGSFRVTNLPPGLSVGGANANGVVNASSAVISGTPTAAGTFVTSILAYEFANLQGDTFGPTTVTFVISGGVQTAPAITQQPSSQMVNTGGAVTFTVAASGSAPLSFQWRKNGAALPGATASSLTISNATASDAGDYTVVASNAVGTATSSTATLSVVDAAARLTNLSVRTAMAATQTLIVGVVVNDGSRDILVRAAGPALAAFGLSTAMSDPRLELFKGADMVLSNNDWPPGLAPMFATVGAFGFPDGSRDAAFVQSMNAAYSIQARGTGPGVVLVEAYDTGAVTAARLVNVSARNRVGTGDDILIAGFNIAGNGPKQLLIRAIGPRLSVFGVPAVLNDPKLEIYNSAGAKVAENDNWQPSLAATFTAVGAFALDPSSRDAALLVALPPGSYTAQVRGADGGTGEALVEIYEVR